MGLGNRVHRWRAVPAAIAQRKKNGKAVFTINIEKELFHNKVVANKPTARELLKEIKKADGTSLLEDKGRAEEINAFIAKLDNDVLTGKAELKKAGDKFKAKVGEFNEKANGTPQNTGANFLEMELTRTIKEAKAAIKSAEDKEEENVKKLDSDDFNDAANKARITPTEYANIKAALKEHNTNKAYTEAKEAFEKETAEKLAAVHKEGNQHAAVQTVFERMLQGGVSQDTVDEIEKKRPALSNPQGNVQMLLGQKDERFFTSKDLAELTLIKSITGGEIGQASDGTLTLKIPEGTWGKPSTWFSNTRYNNSLHQNLKADFMMMASIKKAMGQEELTITLPARKNMEEVRKIARLADEAAVEAGFDRTKVTIKIGEEKIDRAALYKGFAGSDKILTELAEKIDKEQKEATLDNMSAEDKRSVDKTRDDLFKKDGGEEVKGSGPVNN